MTNKPNHPHHNQPHQAAYRPGPKPTTPHPTSKPITDDPKSPFCDPVKLARAAHILRRWYRLHLEDNHLHTPNRQAKRHAANAHCARTRNTHAHQPSDRDTGSR
jgi:hypothetical protein